MKVTATTCLKGKRHRWKSLMISSLRGADKAIFFLHNMRLIPSRYQCFDLEIEGKPGDINILLKSE